MHGTHHSVLDDETNSNFSSGVSVWDRLHKTYRPFAEEKTVSGQSEYRNFSDVFLRKMIFLPIATTQETADESKG